LTELGCSAAIAVNVDGALTWLRQERFDAC